MAGQSSAFDDEIPGGEDASLVGAQVGSLGRIGERPGSETTWQNFLCKSSHPVAAFFHIIFKLAALLLYFFGTWFGLEYVTIFVLCVLLLACDFWTTKNISGRLLVGLRWWVNINDNGTNEWVFESAPAPPAGAPPETFAQAMDRRIFWWALYAAPLAWCAFSFLALVSFSFDWLLVDCVGVGLTGTNLMGYFKCSSDAQRRLRATLTSGAMSGLAYIPGALPALGSTMLGIINLGNANANNSAGSTQRTGATAERQPASSHSSP